MEMCGDEKAPSFAGYGCPALFLLSGTGFLSSLPLVALERRLYERSKRNVLTLGAASCYPFTSYEMCDDNGILLGVNKHNNSLIIVDIFDSRVYKNANISILGTSGATRPSLCS